MAPPPEHQGSSFLRRISIRRNQIVSMDATHEHQQQLEELDYFQKHVSDCLSELLSPSSSAESQPSDPILSIPWLKNLLDVYMSCETEFKGVLSTVQISKSPSLEKALQETLDRILKSLDICNAVSNGIDSVTQSRRLAEIAVTALKRRPLCDGAVRRAKRALTSLLAGLNADGRDSNNRRSTSRSWSFGRSSCHVSKNWSAAKQIHAMAGNLVPPRGAEACGVYVMSSVMVLVMWVLVAAVPCGASNVLAAAPLQLPKHQSWASAALNIQERVGEEMKGKEKRFGGGLGLMEEMQRMERVGLCLLEFTERFRFPGEGEEEVDEVAEKVEEMDEICRGMEVGLEGLQRQVRVVFHRLVRSRLEIVSVLDQAPCF